MLLLSAIVLAAAAGESIPAPAVSPAGGQVMTQTQSWVLLTLLGAVAALAIVFNQISQAWDRYKGTSRTREIGPQPLIVRKQETFVTTEDAERHRQEVQVRMASMERMVATLMSETREDRTRVQAEITAIRTEIHAAEMRQSNLDEERATKIHERINLVLEAVSELRGKVDSL